MTSLQKAAKIVGALFLIAIAASLLGGTMVNSVISASDYFKVRGFGS